MPPEANFRKRFIAFLKKLPNTWYVSVSQRSISGTPDIIACIQGHFVALELKAEKGIPSALQLLAFREIILKGKGKAYIVYPSSFEDIKHELIKLSQGRTP